MDISKLVNRGGTVSPGHLYLFRMRGGYDSMMDNSCKSVDGKIYRMFPDQDDLLAEDLKECDIDYAMLIWADFADSRNMDNVRLEDRNL